MHNRGETYYFRTDGYPRKNLSFGHFFRCLAVAQYLKKKNKRVIFLIKYEKYIKKILRRSNINFINIHFNKSFKINSGILVVDLPIAKKTDVLIAQYKAKIIIIDDFISNRYNCDHYISSNFKASKFSFSYKKIFISPVYRLINNLILSKNHVRKKTDKKNILIFLGGSDLYNIQLKLYNKICKENLYKNYKFYFFVGPGVKKKLSTFKKKNIFFFNKYEKLRLIVQDTFCAICNGGNAMFEMLQLNIPCLAIPSNFQEKANVLFFRKKGIILQFSFKKKLLSQISFFNKIKHKKLFLSNCEKYFGKLDIEKALKKAFLNI